MICPVCHGEYREGYLRCAGCDVDLVEPEPPVELELVKVFETGNPALIPLIKSLFNDAGIEFMEKGDPIQDLFGWGRFGTGLNFVIGPVEFYVARHDAEDATRIVEELRQPVPPIEEEPDDAGGS